MSIICLSVCLQARSSGQLLVPKGVSSCELRWHNTDAWVTAVAFGYTVKVVKASGVVARLEERLLHAAAYGPVGVLRECLERGLAVECRSREGHTPLLRAAISGSAEAAALLLDANADPTATDRHGNSPLHLCALGSASSAQVEVLCGVLVARGASLQARN